MKQRYFALVLDSWKIVPLGEQADFNSADEFAAKTAIHPCWILDEDALRRLSTEAQQAERDCSKQT